MQPWALWLLCLEPLLATCGIPPYALITRAILSAYPRVQLPVCLLLAGCLTLSPSDRATWVLAGLAPAVAAIVQLATHDVQQRTTDRAALRAHYKQALAMLERHRNLPCFCHLVAHIAKKLKAATG